MSIVKPSTLKNGVIIASNGETKSTAGEGSSTAIVSERRLNARDVLALAIWCGLAAGWLEVGTRVLCKSVIGTNRLYLMTRHFV
jgi:hypothetical protein